MSGNDNPLHNVEQHIPVRRANSQERLERFRREAGQREQWRRDAVNTNHQLTENESPVPPSYESATEFPKLPNLLDRALGKKSPKLEEGDFRATLALIETEGNDPKTFEKLHKRALVIKYWIKQHKSVFTETDITQYQEKASILKKARLNVSGIIGAELFSSYESSYYNIINASSNPERLQTAIAQYKTALKDVVNIAKKMHRTFYGLPPSIDENN